MKFQQIFNLDFSNNMTFDLNNIGIRSKKEGKAGFSDYMEGIYKKNNPSDTSNKHNDNNVNLADKSSYFKNNENSISLKKDIVNEKPQYATDKKRENLKEEKAPDEEEKLLEVLKRIFGEEIVSLMLAEQNQQILDSNFIDIIEDLDGFSYEKVEAFIENLISDASIVNELDLIKEILTDIELAPERLDDLEMEDGFFQDILADIKAKVLKENLPGNLNENPKLEELGEEKLNETNIPELDDDVKSMDLNNKIDSKQEIKKKSSDGELKTRDNLILIEDKPVRSGKTIHEELDILKTESEEGNFDKVEGNNGSIMNLDKKLSFDGLKDIIEAQRITKDEILDQITDKVKFVTKKDFSELEVQLKPESLGKLTLKLVLEKGEMTARFIVENNRVKEVVESSFSELKDVLDEKGINIQNLNVTVGQNQQKFNDGARFSDRKKHNKNLNKQGIYEIAIEDNAYISGELNPYYTKEGAFDTKA